MHETKISERTIRDQLQTERNLLFKEFTENPSNISLALQIRLIDDQIAELAGNLVKGQRRLSSACEM